MPDQRWAVLQSAQYTSDDYAQVLDDHLVGWFDHRRLHSSIGNRPPIEHEREYWARVALGLHALPAPAAQQ